MWHEDEPTPLGQSGRRWGAVRALLSEATVAVLMLVGLVTGIIRPGGVHLDSLTEALTQRLHTWGSQALAAAWHAAMAQMASGGEAAEVRALPDFHRVVARGVVHVVLRGGSPQVRVLGTSLQRERILTQVVDGTLSITLAEGSPTSTPISTVEVAAPALEALEASLGSTLHLEGLAGDGLSVSARGGSQVRASGLHLTHMEVVAASGSRVRLEGEGVEELHLHASSGSTVLARTLPVRRLCVRASGGAHIETPAQTSLACQLEIHSLTPPGSGPG